MKKMISLLTFAALAFAGSAHAVLPAASCDAQAAEKKLAGAAKTSFLKKCNADNPANAACDAKAAEKKLAGAAKNSFVKKCVADADAPAAAPVDPQVACDSQAAEKKLAGAAKTSFVKKCVADAK